jgi:rare lipoprotein A
VAIRRVWYYSAVRRLILSVGVLGLCAGLSACGPKTVRAPIPGRQPNQTASAPAQQSLPQSELVGLASYYAEPYHGRQTASGEVFDSYGAMTAAHRTLPFDTVVRVTNQKNGLDVEVRINDRGPFAEGRVIDLSLAAARKIDMVRDGLAPVELKVLRVEPKAAARYIVQVAAFESKDAAEALSADLVKRYKDVSVEKAELDKTYYRVRIVQTDEKSAQRVIDELRRADFQPFMLRGN